MLKFWSVTLNFHVKKKNFDKALRAGQNALNIDSNDATAWAHLGAAYYGKGELERAKEILKKSINLNPNYFLVWFYLGKVFLELNRTDNAFDVCDRCLELNPNFEEAFELRKQILEKKAG